MAGLRIALEAGPVLNNRRYNAHFYSVAASEATAVRPAYTAPGGYAGSQIGVRASKRFARYLVGGFLRYDTLKGAVFQDSSLVRRQSAVTAGIAFAWVFGESSVMVADKE
jgi:outer membrane protein